MVVLRITKELKDSEKKKEMYNAIKYLTLCIQLAQTHVNVDQKN